MVKDAVKNRAIVIMDKNYGGIFETACNTIFMFVDWGKGKITTRLLGREHSDKAVLEFKATDDEMDAIQTRIDDLYPGLCIFNPPMYV